ncbi:sugar ABC transporter ATP-binding protein [Candidatus Caldatribacterium sp.]|uniref:sugar ABC transporter ATP-binding protein n=1 Tax=Candidatus Caldatribacterium sp. TaxID=2282143 RepID=UPI00299A04A2|nr:sugar ABC transporter ATP-binding protein [Candidatus Caldatribacterium sp.]MDW8081264.1 sugar ABC transporter ATP-binding protein [Candidatus Calescibacterium sp.]
MEKAVPVLEVRDVSKTFDGVVRALDSVSIAVYPGEIVGVVGENGAGKSTLMKILSGVYAPDQGVLFLGGKKVPFPRNPKEAAQRGISIVYQERGVIPHLRVYQFLFLGHEEKYRGPFGLCKTVMREEARAILDEFHVTCDTDSFMYELPLATQKMVEIARAVLGIRLERKGEEVTPVIILDEPTAPLTLEERKELFANILRMKERASFIFVSHIIPEVMEFVDRVYVLRDGRLVAHYDFSKDAVTEDDLFRAIVGRESLMYTSSEEIPTVSPEVILRAERLTRSGAYYDVSFELHRGECLGLFGPAGSGKSEIIRTLAGILAFEGGRLYVKGQSVGSHEPPYVRLARGIGYCSGESGKELFFQWSIAKNISIVNLKKVLRRYFPIIHFGKEERMAKAIVEKLGIKAPSVYTDCYALSGGNKQKVSMGKWLERSPDILLLEDPTIGIDVGAREDIYRVLLEMKRRGIALVLVSDDPKEYALLCDRVLVMRKGRVEKVIDARAFQEMAVVYQ